MSFSIKSINPKEKYPYTLLNRLLPSPALFVPSADLITPGPGMLEGFDYSISLHINRFPNKLASNVPNNILINTPLSL